MFFVDTNIFLEVVFKDARWEECYSFLTNAAKGEIKVLTSDFIIYSTILEIEAKAKSLSKIKKFVESIPKYLGLTVYHPSEKELSKALVFMEKYNLDFDDALVVACMANNKIRKLVSFDSDFNRIKEIERIEPNQI